MKYFWILVAVMAVGCGDESNFGRPSTSDPEPELVSLGEARLAWNEPTVSIRVEIGDLDQVRTVRVRCSGDCLTFDSVRVWDPDFGVYSTTGRLAILDGLPIEAFRGEWQEVEITASSSARGDLEFELLAEILK